MKFMKISVPTEHACNKGAHVNKTMAASLGWFYWLLRASLPTLERGTKMFPNGYLDSSGGGGSIRYYDTVRIT
ncbi:hypothetical protein [Succinimonas sp.]|uniref:hypothetical protein n=1 Tax=Succinimonas sp. TaxID=1936151 RepID=UPI0038698F98